MIETMVAITIILTSLVGVMSLFANNIKANQATKNRVIAINLAREGIEVARFMRDSNWLVFSNNRRACWNNNDTAVCNDTDNNGMTDYPFGGNYYVSIDPASFILDLKPDHDGIDKDNQVYIYADLYKHFPVFVIPTATKTPFLRQVQISYPDGGATISTDNRMLVKSIVQWGNESLELEAVLTDFLGRTGHDD